MSHTFPKGDEKNSYSPNKPKLPPKPPVQLRSMAPLGVQRSRQVKEVITSDPGFVPSYQKKIALERQALEKKTSPSSCDAPRGSADGYLTPEEQGREPRTSAASLRVPAETPPGAVQEITKSPTL